jgi:hypothetical protein
MSSFECKRCGMLVADEPPSQHKCNPISIIKWVLRKADEAEIERRKNELSKLR